MKELEQMLKPSVKKPYIIYTSAKGCEAIEKVIEETMKERIKNITDL